MLYADIKEGKVVNILVSQSKLKDTWVSLEGVDPLPAKGDLYVDGSFTEDPSVVPKFFTSNTQVKVNGVIVEGVNGYPANSGDTIELDIDIVDAEGNVMVSLDQASLVVSTLKVPMVKFLEGINSPILDKIYFDVTLINGHVKVTGSFPTGGDWKMTEDRTNAALDSVNAGFHIARKPLTFLV